MASSLSFNRWAILVQDSDEKTLSSPTIQESHLNPLKRFLCHFTQAIAGLIGPGKGEF